MPPEFTWRLTLPIRIDSDVPHDTVAIPTKEAGMIVFRFEDRLLVDGDTLGLAKF